MNFTMPKGSSVFFGSMSGAGLEAWLMFDSWYVCMLRGIHARKLGDVKFLEDRDFIREYPSEYKGKADYIAGLLIDAELERASIAVSDRASVEAVMIELLDPSRATGLSPDGVRLLNRYAVTGFEEMRDAMENPASRDDFLIAYADLWPKDA